MPSDAVSAADDVLSACPRAGLGAWEVIDEVILRRSNPSENATPTTGASAPSVPVPAEPGSTTASFGDWVLRCQRVGEGEKAERLCEVAQAMHVKGQGAPIAQIAIGRVSREPLRITVVLPVAVSFPSSVQLYPVPGSEDQAAANTSAPLDLTWRRCLPSGCFADAVATEDALKRWRGNTGPGRILFKDSAGQDMTIPLSLRGFSQALDALAKETRQ